MDDPTALDYWTLAIALVGAGTGVAALVAQVWGQVASGPRIRVTLASTPSTGRRGWSLSLDASNVGRLPVTLLETGVMYRAGGEWVTAPLRGLPPESWSGPTAPHRLADAEAVTWFMDPRRLAPAFQVQQVTEVRGYVRLATGKTVRSRKITQASLDGPD